MNRRFALILTVILLSVVPGMIFAQAVQVNSPFSLGRSSSTEVFLHFELPAFVLFPPDTLPRPLFTLADFPAFPPPPTFAAPFPERPFIELELLDLEVLDLTFDIHHPS